MQPKTPSSPSCMQLTRAKQRWPNPDAVRSQYSSIQRRRTDSPPPGCSKWSSRYYGALTRARSGPYREGTQEAARYGFLQVCKLCLQIADDETLNRGSREQWTALHQGAQNGCDEIVTLLLDNGYNVES